MDQENFDNLVSMLFLYHFLEKEGEPVTLDEDRFNEVESLMRENHIVLTGNDENENGMFSSFTLFFTPVEEEEFSEVEEE